jgi:hypothetical protein
MVVYLAADAPLPLIDWSDNRPAFHVTELIPEDYRVRKQFSKPFVYYLGSHHKCGCGFRYGDQPLSSADDRQEDRDARDCVAALSTYLEAAVRHGPVEIFACWDGDQECEPANKTVLSTSDFYGDEFAFLEKELITIVADD